MTLNIEVEFMYSGNPIETSICIMCNRRPIREGGIAKCQVCSDMTIARRMNEEFDRQNASRVAEVDESHPDIADYIKHNADENTSYVVTLCCGGHTFFEVCDIKDLNENTAREKYGIEFDKNGNPVHVNRAWCYGEENEENEEDIDDET